MLPAGVILVIILIGLVGVLLFSIFFFRKLMAFKKGRAAPQSDEGLADPSLGDSLQQGDNVLKRESSQGGPGDVGSDDDDAGGKLGRERRKIEIKFIQDKSRRHITFSKRKAGIMKKAYELSVLTGTQVLLLVVSETGLVYTFTTPKLQPLVTKPEGKNLIQACLNASDDVPVAAAESQEARQQQQQHQQQRHSSHVNSQANGPGGSQVAGGELPDQLVEDQLGGHPGLAGRGPPPNMGGMQPGMNYNMNQDSAAQAYQHYLSMPQQQQQQQQQQQRYMAAQPGHMPHQAHQ